MKSKVEWKMKNEKRNVFKMMKQKYIDILRVFTLNQYEL